MAKDLEIALRLKADMDAGRRELERLSSSLEKTGTTASTVSADLDGVSTSVDKTATALEKTDQAAQRMGGSFEQWNRIFTQTQQDLADWEEANAGALRSMEDIAAQEERLDRLMAQGVITMKEYEKSLQNLDKAEQQLTKEHTQQERSLQRVMRTADRAAAELQKLDAAAEELEQAWRDGRISATEYDRALAGIARRRAEIERTGGTMRQLGLHTQTARLQVVQLGRNLASGDFSRAGTDFARLGLNVRSLGGGLLGMLVPLAGVAAGVGALSYVTHRAWRENVEFEKTLTLTGNAAGLTRGTFDELSASIADHGDVTIGTAREIAQALARTGRMGREQIESFGRTIAQLQRVSGQSTDELVRDFARMEDGVAKWVAERNRSMHFVTLEQYEYIRAVEETQGAEAAQIEASRALSEHLEKNARELGIIERTWRGIQNVASDARNAISNIGRTDDEYRLEQLQGAIAAAMERVSRIYREQQRDTQMLRQAQSQLNALLEEESQIRARVARQQADAAAAAEQAQRDTAAGQARDSLREQLVRISPDAQRERDIRELNRQWAAALTGETQDLDQAAFDRLREAIEERYKDRSIDQQARAAESYVKSLERQAEAIGKTAAEMRLLASQEHDLTDAQRERVNGILIELQWEEERQQAMRDRLQLETLEIQLLRAQGREAEAAAREMRRRYDDVLAGMGDDAGERGREIVDQLINLEALNQRLAGAQQSINDALTAQQRAESSITAQREAGLITEAEARRRIVALHRETYDLLVQQRPLLEEMAQQPGAVGDAAREALAALDGQLLALQATMDRLQATLRTGIESGLTDALVGLAQGTYTLQEAIAALGQTVLNALVQMAAQDIAQSITGRLFNRDGGAEMAQGAAAVSASAAALSVAGGTLVTGAQAIERAAASLAAANAAGGAGGGGGDGNNYMQWAQFAMAFAATGGHITGPGSATSDSIPAMLSNGEYVTRAAVVNQPGALDFLHDFNQRGMSALANWLPAYHNTGGLAGYPAPAAPNPTLGMSSIPEPESAFSAQLANNFKFNLIDDPQRITEALASASGERAITIMISKNPAKFRQLLGV